MSVAIEADATHPIVRAASYCVKVARDHALKPWDFGGDIGYETTYGSVYPNDPATKMCLEENLDPIFGFSPVLRFRCSTAEKCLYSKAVAVDWEDLEVEGAAVFQTITSLFGCNLN